MSLSKSFTLTLIVICLVCAACSPAGTIPPATVTVSATPQTPQPSPSLTVTLLPTITPTFDVRTIVTVTPAPAAKCPQATPVTNPDIKFLLGYGDEPETIHQNILNFLNRFGIAALQKAVQQSSLSIKNRISFQDLTNDGLPEVAIPELYLSIFGCKNGYYQDLLEGNVSTQGPLYIKHIEDVNQNGIPELTIELGRWVNGKTAYNVYEWDGQSFSSLLLFHYEEFQIEYSGKIYYEDMDHDSIKEFILDKGVPVPVERHGLPARNKRIIYKWNGTIYNQISSEYDPPEYRFQAIQDGDVAAAEKAYDKAFAFYQQAILNDKLKAYSLEIAENLWATWVAQFPEASGTPTPTPAVPDPTEAPQLAAYAYYRMVILHAQLGQTDAAAVRYATLQEKFPANSPGHPYAEMASAFWGEYQKAQSMVNACGAAIRYAGEHPQMLTVLGSDYHGTQSHKYIAADVCPFQ